MVRGVSAAGRRAVTALGDGISALTALSTKGQQCIKLRNNMSSEIIGSQWGKDSKMNLHANMTYNY